MVKETYRGMVKEKGEKMQDKILGGVTAPFKEQVEKIEDKIVTGVEDAIKDIVKRFKDLEEVTGIGIAEIEVSFEAEGKLGSIVSLLATAQGKGGIKIRLQPKEPKVE